MDGIIDSVDMDLSQLWDMVKDREAWRAEAHGSQRVRHPIGLTPGDGHLARPVQNPLSPEHLGR